MRRPLIAGGGRRGEATIIGSDPGVVGAGAISGDVPEPARWALILAGFMGLGSALFREVTLAN